MKVLFHPHALERIAQRGASEDEVRQTIEQGESFPAKHGRTGFRRNFAFDGVWQGRTFRTKQVEAYAVWEDEAWLVISVLVKFF